MPRERQGLGNRQNKVSLEWPGFARIVVGLGAVPVRTRFELDSDWFDRRPDVLEASEASWGHRAKNYYGSEVVGSSRNPVIFGLLLQIGLARTARSGVLAPSPRTSLAQFLLNSRVFGPRISSLGILELAVV